MNGYFTKKLMLDRDGNGLPFMCALLAEERDSSTLNKCYSGEVTSLEIYGSIASASLVQRGWQTHDKGGWHFHEVIQLLRKATQGSTRGVHRGDRQ